ncbi:MAG: hypothetical protein GXY13_05585 [Acidimicrobiales bacterium]|nr:hypothetical protein [Acidimicrobiales bacterium]
MTEAADIPRAHTPPGGYGDVMPPPILDGCTDALAPGAPDLRGTWRVVEVWDDSGPLPTEHRVWNHVERIEQAGDRVVVTGGGVVHDMVVDGTFENGLDDVMVADFSTRLIVAATYEDGALVLRPRDIPDVIVRRWRDGDHLMWTYHTLFTARLAPTP